MSEITVGRRGRITKPLTGSERLSLKCGTEPTCSPPNKANSNADNEAFHAAEFARAENRAGTRHLQFALGLSRALSRRAILAGRQIG